MIANAEGISFFYWLTMRTNQKIFPILKDLFIPLPQEKIGLF